MNSLLVSNVTKNYRDVRALNNVSVEFERNKIYGLLGRNGAGKTTLLNIITGKIFADQGNVTLNGKEVFENDEMLQNIFMMSERNYYPEGMRISDAFRWTKEFYPEFDEKRAADLAEQFGLETVKKIRSLSTGYGSIFKLITALCVNVPFVFLDEPVLGLDANHREVFPSCFRIFKRRETMDGNYNTGTDVYVLQRAQLASYKESCRKRLKFKNGGNSQAISPVFNVSI